MNIRRQSDINGINMRDKADPRRTGDGAFFNRRHGRMLVDNDIVKAETDVARRLTPAPSDVVRALWVTWLLVDRFGW